MTATSSGRRAPKQICYWLFKSEPAAYSIDDLAAARRDLWDGIRNYQARNLMRDMMRVGDELFFYHSSCASPAIVGTAKITKAARPDPTQFDANERYYDSKSDPQNPRWLCVEVEFVSKARQPYTLQQMRNEPRLEGLELLKRGNRMSLQPVSRRHWKFICAKLR